MKEEVARIDDDQGEHIPVSAKDLLWASGIWLTLTSTTFILIGSTGPALVLWALPVAVIPIVLASLFRRHSLAEAFAVVGVTGMFFAGALCCVTVDSWFVST